MAGQEIDSNEIIDSKDITLSENVYNLYLDSLTKSCKRVTLEHNKAGVKVIGENCGCQRKE